MKILLLWLSLILSGWTQPGQGQEDGRASLCFLVLGEHCRNISLIYDNDDDTDPNKNLYERRTSTLPECTSAPVTSAPVTSAPVTSAPVNSCWVCVQTEEQKQEVVAVCPLSEKGKNLKFEARGNHLESKPTQCPGPVVPSPTPSSLLPPPTSTPSPPPDDQLGLKLGLPLALGVLLVLVVLAIGIILRKKVASKKLRCRSGLIQDQDLEKGEQPKTNDHNENIPLKSMDTHNGQSGAPHTRNGQSGAPHTRNGQSGCTAGTY